MKRKPIALALLLTAALSVGLTGCGDDSVEILEKRVTQGKDAGDVVDKAKELNQEQSDELDKYLED